MNVNNKINKHVETEIIPGTERKIGEKITSRHIQFLSVNGKEQYVEKHLQDPPEKEEEKLNLKSTRRRETRVRSLIRRDGPFCFYCYIVLVDDRKCNDNSLTFDHIVPRAKGGTHARYNLVLACFRCNSLKGDRDVEEFLKSMKFSVRKFSVMTKIQKEARRDNDYFDLFKGAK